jgi:patatin-like phospholipase/acyl hydrolase
VIAGRTRDEHLFGPGPKRILALDGGGVRGVISLAYLERIEAILRRRFGPETVLADYFDLIGGASTGAIIATGLDLGLPVERLIATQEQRELDALTRFDEPAISPRLLELARLAASKQIAEAHLPAEFDLR